MRVLLLSPPFKTDYMRNARCDFVSLSHTQWYPILLGSMGAFLEKHGHSVLLIDGPAAGLSVQRVSTMAQDFRPEVLVVYGGRMSEQTDQELTDQLTKILGCRTVFCGPFVSIAPRRWLENTTFVEAAITGECEMALLDYVEGVPNESIGNLTFRRGEEIVSNALRPNMSSAQLDAIPFVSGFFKRQLNLNNYRAISERFPFIDMMTGRGCIWGLCTYCLWVHTFIKGRTYNQRSIENVIGELVYIRTWMPDIRSIMFQDDVLPEPRIVEICEAMLTHEIKTKWSCYTRANLDIRTLQLMKKAGCLNLHVGFESSDNKTLKQVRKGITMERMSRFAHDSHKAGLHIHGDFMIGLPGETATTIKKTVEWAMSLKVDSAQFQVMIPFEGTALYHSLLESGQLRNGYPNYPDLSTEKLHQLSRKAYRAFYLRPEQLLRILAHPQNRLWHYIKVAHKIIPSVLWRSGS